LRRGRKKATWRGRKKEKKKRARFPPNAGPKKRRVMKKRKGGVEIDSLMGRKARNKGKAMDGKRKKKGKREYNIPS